MYFSGKLIKCCKSKSSSALFETYLDVGRLQKTADVLLFSKNSSGVTC